VADHGPEVVAEWAKLKAPDRPPTEPWSPGAPQPELPAG